MNEKNVPKFEGTCLDLALEGERLCRIGECELGVQYLESALSMDNKDLKTLSAIYNQLGNAYLFLQNYSKSLEYYKQALDVSRTLGDSKEEAKASGNLANTLKFLGNFDEAFSCCQRQLDISRELDDKENEAKALYNLGSVFHTKCKQVTRLKHNDPGSYSQENRDLLETAISYYEANLELVRHLDDKASIGRTCGNLGNTHYLLGNFKKAIGYHEERLQFAELFGDLTAQRRAHNNLGNAYMFLGDFRKAVQLYKKALELAVEIKDLPLEAQACYSLGNTYTLLRDYPAAVEYHMRHLRIAQRLRDRVGEGKACWSLSNVFANTRSASQALDFARQHLSICKEMEDQKGFEMAQVNLRELKALASAWDDSSSFKRANSCREKGDGEKVDVDGTESCGSRRRSMENLVPDKFTKKFQFKAPDITLWRKGGKGDSEVKKNKKLKKQSSDEADDGSFLDMLLKYQSRRLDDQRCPSSVLSKTPSKQKNEANQATVAFEGTVGRAVDLEDDFLDMLVGLQSCRMDDQRSQLPTSLREAVARSSPSHSTGGLSVASAGTVSSVDEQFYEMLIKYQGSRLDNQRSVLPTPSSHLQASTVPEEDFMNPIQRFQCRRLEDQRCFMSSDSPHCSKPDLLKH